MQALVVVLIMLGMTAAGNLLLGAIRLRPRLSWGGDLVIAFLVGSGVTTLIGFWVSLAAASAGLLVSLIASAAALLVAMGILAKRLIRRLVWPHQIPLSTLVATPLVLVALFDVGLVVAVVLRGDPGWDGLFVWGIKARYFAAIGGVPASFFTDLSREWSHLDYPFLIPMAEAMAYRVQGGPTEQVDMLITAGFVVALVVLFHELIRNAAGPVLAVVFTLLLVTVPAFWTNATRAYADLPLALFLLGGGGLVASWFARGRLTDLILGGAMLAFGMWVKRDGIMVWAAAATAVMVWTITSSIRLHRITWRPLVGYLVPAIAVVPWWATVAWYHLADPSYAPIGIPWLVDHADRVPILLNVLADQLLLASSWGFVWVLVAAAVVLRPPIRSAPRGFLLWAVVVHLLSLTMIYTFSTWDPYMNHVNSSIDRLVFQVLPLGLLILSTAIGVDPSAALPAARRPDHEGLRTSARADSLAGLLRSLLSG